MKSERWVRLLKQSSLHLLVIFSLSFTPGVWALAATDVALIGLLMDSYRLKIATWSEPDSYTPEGPGPDVRQLELSMDQRLIHVEDSGDQLKIAGDRLRESARAFALEWQDKGAPHWSMVEEVERSGQNLGEVIKGEISQNSDAKARAEQIDLLLQLASIYVFMGGQNVSVYSVDRDQDIHNMVAQLDKSFATTPVDNRAFATKWRYIKPVILKMDYRAPTLIKRHALSMANLLERSLD